MNLANMQRDVELSHMASRDSGAKKVDGSVHVHEAQHGIELDRRFSFFACLGLAFSLLNSWTGE